MRKKKSRNGSAQEEMTGEQLRRWRSRRKLSQEQVAAETWSTLGTIRNYEQDRRRIPPVFQRVLKLLDQSGKFKDA